MLSRVKHVIPNRKLSEINGISALFNFYPSEIIKLYACFPRTHYYLVTESKKQRAAVFRCI